MEITFLGHSSFKIKGKKVTLVSDPFDPQMVGFKFPKVSADIVTISHDHKDHNRADLVGDVKKIIFGAGEYEIQETSILGIASFHDSNSGKERGKNVIYVVEMDKIRLVHLGDLGHVLSDKMIEEIGEVDILFVPVGGKYTIDYKQATQVVDDLEPKIVIPMHYQMAGLNPEVFSELAGIDLFLGKIDLKVERLEKLKIQKDNLPEEEQKLVLLTKI